ncbi:MAG TPA: hypothetical protein VL633_03565 [Bacteroidota bacterium]|nr:hypothetical protein [Bacteroidota bacterium]
MHSTSSNASSVSSIECFESQKIIGGIQDVSADGQKCLVLVGEDHKTSPPMTLVVHWDQALKKK